ncbi:MAG: hypothetical protein HZA17_05215 [Nitrospirae bacterium]|nr:hypothetical protein [Nitrospirota bacterium]
MLKRRELLRGLIAAGLAGCLPRFSFAHTTSEILMWSELPNNFEIVLDKRLGQELNRDLNNIDCLRENSLQIAYELKGFNAIMRFKGRRDIGYGTGCPKAAVNEAISFFRARHISLKKAEVIILRILVRHNVPIDIVRDINSRIYDMANPDCLMISTAGTDSRLSSEEVGLAIIATGINGPSETRRSMLSRVRA